MGIYCKLLGIDIVNYVVYILYFIYIIYNVYIDIYTALSRCFAAPTGS